MDVQKLRQLLLKEEGEKLDFKAELHLSTEGEKKELVKDVTAIANSRGGRGHIIFGVEDKTKRILGIDPKIFQEEQIQQIIYNRTDPPVPVNLDLVQVEDKTVAVLTIFACAPSNAPIRSFLYQTRFHHRLCQEVGACLNDAGKRVDDF